MRSACQAKLMVSVGDKSHEDIHSMKVFGAPRPPPPPPPRDQGL